MLDQTTASAIIGRLGPAMSRCAHCGAEWLHVHVCPDQMSLTVPQPAPTLGGQGALAAASSPAERIKALEDKVAELVGTLLAAAVLATHGSAVKKLLDDAIANGAL